MHLISVLIATIFAPSIGEFALLSEGYYYRADKGGAVAALDQDDCEKKCLAIPFCFQYMYLSFYRPNTKIEAALSKGKNCAYQYDGPYPAFEFLTRPAGMENGFPTANESEYAIHGRAIPHSQDFARRKQYADQDQAKHYPLRDYSMASFSWGSIKPHECEAKCLNDSRCFSVIFQQISTDSSQCLLNPTTMITYFFNETRLAEPGEQYFKNKVLTAEDAKMLKKKASFDSMADTMFDPNFVMSMEWYSVSQETECLIICKKSSACSAAEYSTVTSKCKIFNIEKNFVPDMPTLDSVGSIILLKK